MVLFLKPLFASRLHLDSHLGNATCDGGQGPGVRPWVFFIFFFILNGAVAEVSSTSTTQQKAIKKMEKVAQLKSQPWSKFYAYVPEKVEYNFELGTMWEASNLYWLGGNMGFHLGRCMFSQSQTCQQFADFMGGVGGRSGHTNGVVFSSLRWQFTDLSDKFVTHARVLLGAINHRDEQRDRTVFAYGVGYGVTAAIHERLDLKFELRAGHGDQWWSQSFVSFSLKFDRFVDYFAKKLEQMGIAGRLVKGTAEFTGKVIRGTVETSGKVIQGTMQTTSDVLSEGSEKAKQLLYDKKDNPSRENPKGQDEDKGNLNKKEKLKSE